MVGREGINFMNNEAENMIVKISSVAINLAEIIIKAVCNCYYELDLSNM